MSFYNIVYDKDNNEVKVEWVTTDEAAERLNVCVTSIYKYIRKEKLDRLSRIVDSRFIPHYKWDELKRFSDRFYVPDGYILGKDLQVLYALTITYFQNIVKRYNVRMVKANNPYSRSSVKSCFYHEEDMKEAMRKDFLRRRELVIKGLYHERDYQKEYKRRIRGSK